MYCLKKLHNSFFLVFFFYLFLFFNEQKVRRAAFIWNTNILYYNLKHPCWIKVNFFKKKKCEGVYAVQAASIFCTNTWTDVNLLSVPHFGGTRMKISTMFSLKDSPGKFGSAEHKCIRGMCHSTCSPCHLIMINVISYATLIIAIELLYSALLFTFGKVAIVCLECTCAWDDVDCHTQTLCELECHQNAILCFWKNRSCSAICL